MDWFLYDRDHHHERVKFIKVKDCRVFVKIKNQLSRLTPFWPNVLFLYPLKTSEKERFSHVLRGYRNGYWAKLGLDILFESECYRFKPKRAPNWALESNLVTRLPVTERSKCTYAVMNMLLARGFPVAHLPSWPYGSRIYYQFPTLFWSTWLEFHWLYPFLSKSDIVIMFMRQAIIVWYSFLSKLDIVKMFMRHKL